MAENIVDTETTEIKNKAYELYKKHGFKDGNDYVDWLEAEKQEVGELRLKRRKELHKILLTIVGILCVSVVILLILLFRDNSKTELSEKSLSELKVMMLVLDQKPDEEVVAFGHKHNIVIASDEAYTEMYFSDDPPHSILEITKEGVVAFHSLSKRSAMTCYRVGWIAGDKRIVDIFKKVKTNIDSGTATFIQDGAIAALGDEGHVETMRREYREKRDILVKALTQAGLPECMPESTLYVWQRIPKGMSSVEFAKKLLDPEVAIVTTPGAWLSDRTESGHNPGEGFVRFALVPSIEKTQEAAEHLKNLKF